MKPEMYTCQSLAVAERSGCKVPSQRVKLRAERSILILEICFMKLDVWQLPFQPTLAMKKHYPPRERPWGLDNHLQTWELFVFSSNLSGASVINVHMSSITWHYSVLAGDGVLIVSLRAVIGDWPQMLWWNFAFRLVFVGLFCFWATCVTKWYCKK